MNIKAGQENGAAHLLPVKEWINELNSIDSIKIPEAGSSVLFAKAIRFIDNDTCYAPETEVGKRDYRIEAGNYFAVDSKETQGKHCEGEKTVLSRSR